MVVLSLDLSVCSCKIFRNMTVCFALTVYINHVDMLRLCFYIYTGHSGVSQDSV